MAIVKMNKITLAAPQNFKEDILNFIQTEEKIHFTDLSEASADFEGVDCFEEGKAVSQSEMNYNQIRTLYEFLKQNSTEKKGIFSKKEVISKKEFDELENSIDWRGIYREFKEIEEGINSNKSEKNKVNSLLQQYSEWINLDISITQLEKIKKAAYFIGSINDRYEGALYEELNNNFNDVYIEKISSKQQDVNLLLICHSSDINGVGEILKKYGFTRTALDLVIMPKAQVDELGERSEKLENEMKQLVDRSVNLSEHIGDIEKIYDFYTVRLEKDKTVSKLLKTQNTFILQGWVEAEKADEVKAKLEDKFNDVYITVKEPDEGDAPPILLKNNSFAEPFEVITSLYSLPLHTEIDPTPVIAPFFMFFFGMMMADIGYGLVMAVIGIVALKYVELDSGTRKMVRLVLYCSVPTIIFGFLYGSFFGGIIKLTPLWIDPVNKPMDVLIWSMVFGLVHLFTGLGVKGYMYIKAGKILDAVYDVLFWYVLIIGLVLLLTVGGTAAKVMSIVGALGLLATQGRSNATIVGKFFGGLYGLYGITGYLGDTLSYSRLLALGLATGLIGWAFNLLIDLMSGPAKYIAGPLIFIAGHSFNFAIGALGTFVHTSRLQYLEFFGKFYEGGGKAYTPLKISTKFVNVKKS